MRYIGFDETVLLFRSRVLCLSHGVRDLGVVVIVTPFREVICELISLEISICIFKIDDDKLLMLVGGS